MVLTGDADPSAGEFLNRMVGAVMTELHLEGASTAGQRHDLVPQANAKSGDTAVDQLGSGGNRVLAGLRVTWTVAQKNTVGPVGQHSRRRGLGRHHRDPTAALGKHAQDVLLDSKIIGQHMVGRLRLLAIAGLPVQAGLGQTPLGLAPCIGAGVDTCRAKSKPAMLGAAAASASACAISAGVSASPAERPRMQPFCAPWLRSWRVSLRVSMLAMATVRSRCR